MEYNLQTSTNEQINDSIITEPIIEDSPIISNEKLETNDIAPPLFSSKLFLYIIGIIFILTIILLILYVYQVNTRNKPPVPLITNFGVSIKTLDDSKFWTMQGYTTTWTPTSVFPMNILAIAPKNVVAGESSSGWLISNPFTITTNNGNKINNVVTIRSNFTGNYLYYVVGNIPNSRGNNTGPDNLNYNGIILCNLINLTLAPPQNITTNNIQPYFIMNKFNDGSFEFETIIPAGYNIIIGKSVNICEASNVTNSLQIGKTNNIRDKTFTSMIGGIVSNVTPSPTLTMS